MTDHIIAADVIDARLTKLWAVYRTVADEASNLTLLALVHRVREDYPNAEFIHIEVTDQGGETMTFSSLVLSDGTEIEDDEKTDLYMEYLESINSYDLNGFDYFVSQGRRSGRGHLIVAKVFEALEPLYREFIAGQLKPMPDSTDTEAVRAWLEQETR